MSLHATRGWGYGPVRAVEPVPRREPMSKQRSREFAQRQALALGFLHAGNMVAEDLREAMGLSKVAAWRVLNALFRAGAIEVVSKDYLGIVYGVRRAA